MYLRKGIVLTCEIMQNESDLTLASNREPQKFDPPPPREFGRYTSLTLIWGIAKKIPNPCSKERELFATSKARKYEPATQKKIIRGGGGTRRNIASFSFTICSFEKRRRTGATFRA